MWVYMWRSSLILLLQLIKSWLWEALALTLTITLTLTLTLTNKQKRVDCEKGGEMLITGVTDLLMGFQVCDIEGKGEGPCPSSTV